MSDLLHVLADFPTAPFSHLLPSLDRALITTSDLLTLDSVDIAKRAQLPPAEVNKLADAVLRALHKDLGIQEQTDNPVPQSENEEATVHVTSPSMRPWTAISTLDSTLDAALGGGIPTGYVTEITGERYCSIHLKKVLILTPNSGAGKTQFLLTLLLSAQLPPPRGISRPSLYISTEAALSTSRLSQLLRTNPFFSSLSPNEKPTLNKIFSTQTSDLEAQDHILRYQVPVAIQRQNVGLIVIDSIASNYRAEFEHQGASNTNNGNSQGNVNPNRRGARAMAERRTQLVQLGGFLRKLARTESIAVVIANQVADRFSPTSAIVPAHTSNHPLLPSTPVVTPDPLTLDHQQRWFTGWGDLQGPECSETSLKTPSLGLVWTNQIAARIALIKESNKGDENRKRKRWLRVAFAPWVEASKDVGLEYEIIAGGVKAVAAERGGDERES